MDVRECINRRYSYRGTFLNTPIPREDLKEILEAGLAAPSGCNMQTTEIIAVDKPALVKELAEIYGHEWAQSSVAAILVLTKELKSYKGVSYHVHDYCAATQNMLLLIASKGYAGVWLEGQIMGKKAEKMGTLLGVPKDMTPVIYIPMGIPKEEGKRVKKKSFEERAWFNGYRIP